MKTKLWAICITGLFGLAIVAAAAQPEFPEVIAFPGAVGGTGPGGVFKSVYSGPVKFTHLKHVQDYGAACGDCHHDENAEPIEAYDPAAVYICSECHANEGLLTGPLAENSTPREDQLAYRANAIHMQCIGCHQMYNNLNQVVRVPESCKTCHARRSADWVLK